MQQTKYIKVVDASGRLLKTCHPALARLLVKQRVAHWKAGQRGEVLCVASTANAEGLRHD